MAENGSKKEYAGLVTALAAGLSIKDAAEQSGYGERTIYRRLKEADFRRRVCDARTEMVSKAIGKLADAASEAVDAMRSLLSSQKEAARLGAARAVLEFGHRLRETNDLEKRVAELESRLADKETLHDHSKSNPTA